MSEIRNICVEKLKVLSGTVPTLLLIIISSRMEEFLMDLEGKYSLTVP